ncbi:GrpB family protein [Maledivibacter halophilus]|uniref:GrpB domain, predicted nucleotidyltransferase, UPF0157 family n=1 Tax=Maledivibacter halophilus TaxID=36842 RepID=A0A1T5LSU2_9FIRM|nr:GrpB family protein [Maledivibacter halophilus]SKC79046.1 GrpB domain, predicted nucleotidyltransferase, UPF0157 family [Maledivibacter halophilus]
MNKSLSEMTNEELWKLFPIVLSEHMSIWKENYLTEKTLIKQTLRPQNIVRINHFGSTSVPGLIAKPTVDILLEIANDTNIEKLKLDIQSIGYIYSEQPENPPPHMMFMKGYTPQGFKEPIYHVHVRYSGDWDELYFRDYLIAHPDVAKEYGKLKVELKKKYEHDRDGYTYAKTDFIRKVTKLARLELKKKWKVK